jgi:hypothetical protein
LLALLLGTVVVGSPATLGATGGPTGEAPAVRVPLEVIAVPGALAMLAGLGLLLAALGPVRRRRRDPDQPDWVYQPPPTSWSEKALLLLVMLLLVAAVAGAVWLFARRDAPSQPGPTPSTALRSSPATPPPSAPASPSSPPQAAWLWPTAGLAALAAGTGLLALRTVRHRRGPANPTGRAPDRLADLVDTTLEDLRVVSAPRQAILAAYARMERTLAPRGAGRQRHETALEYLDRVLARLEIEPAPLRRLTGLFELAKFSNHEVTETMRDDALAALGAISAALRSPS